jgi:hypothetical protein
MYGWQVSEVVYNECSRSTVSQETTAFKTISLSANIMAENVNGLVRYIYSVSLKNVFKVCGVFNCN